MKRIAFNYAGFAKTLSLIGLISAAFLSPVQSAPFDWSTLDQTMNSAVQKDQFLGWPITVSMKNNDGRKVLGWLPELVFEKGSYPVVQVIEDATGDILYTIRAQGGRSHPRVYSIGTRTIKLRADKPDAQAFAALEPQLKTESGQRTVRH